MYRLPAIRQVQGRASRVLTARLGWVNALQHPRCAQGALPGRVLVQWASEPHIPVDAPTVRGVRVLAIPAAGIRTPVLPVGGEVAPGIGAGAVGRVKSSGDTLTSWIAGLMRENYEAVGFLPYVSVEQQYVANGRYVLQQDERGRRVGYLLHGAPEYGRSLNVAQHCIQYDSRTRGYGEQALATLVERAERAGCAGIRARCATDLESVGFWLAQGFELREVIPGGRSRDRRIARLFLPLHAPLLETA